MGVNIHSCDFGQGMNSTQMREMCAKLGSVAPSLPLWFKLCSQTEIMLTDGKS